MYVGSHHRQSSRNDTQLFLNPRSSVDAIKHVVANRRLASNACLGVDDDECSAHELLVVNFVVGGWVVGGVQLQRRGSG